MAAAIVLALTLSPGMGCTPVPGHRAAGSATEATMLAGTWRKITDSPCSRVYPDVIEFREGGLYSARGGAPGDEPGWDAGTWEVIGPTRARISTANDAKVVYDFSIEEELLTFVSQGGCRFQFRRAG